MRIQRRLYGFNTVSLIIFMVPYGCKLVSFFEKSLNKPLKYHIPDRKLTTAFNSSYLKNFKSFLQSHPLRVTLCIINLTISTWVIKVYSTWRGSAEMLPGKILENVRTSLWRNTWKWKISNEDRFRRNLRKRHLDPPPLI